jgi:hypothetical protein
MSEGVVICLYCGEPVVQTENSEWIQAVHMVDDTLVTTLSQAHTECKLRQVLGGPAHVLELCTCYGGTWEDPDMGMTPRKAALWVWNFYLVGERNAASS